METDKNSPREVIIDFHLKLPGKSHSNLLEANVDSSAESCILSLIAYRIFPNNLTANELPKPDALHSVTHIILESQTDGILPVFGTDILKVVYHRTGKLMLIVVFVVDTQMI